MPNTGLTFKSTAFETVTVLEKPAGETFTVQVRGKPERGYAFSHMVASLSSEYYEPNFAPVHGKMSK